MEHNVDSQLLNESLLENYQCGLERYESVSPSLQLDIEDSKEARYRSVSECSSADSGIAGDLQAHERLVVGTFIDPNICSGFMYRVRPLMARKKLFKGQPLHLQSIGMGYGKRITFASEKRNGNENYFWSDNYPSGYGFSIHVISVGEKFTIYDANHLAIGTCEIIEVDEAQFELEDEETVQDSVVTKHVEVEMLGNVEWFDDVSDTTAQPCRVAGVALVSRRKASKAKVNRVISVTVANHRGLTLLPGVSDKVLPTHINGALVGDVPVRLTINGLEAYEFPVIGTYVDPRILPGFFYRARPAHSRKSLFGGQALLLKSIGRGYGKRITFDSDRLNHNNNYFWSDSFYDGLGFSIQVVFVGMDFVIEDQNGAAIGRARITKADVPQVEEDQVIKGESISKRVRVDIICNITFDHEEEVRTLRVNGLAIVDKSRWQPQAQVTSIVNIGIASQLYVMFMNTRTTLTFRPVRKP